VHTSRSSRGPLSRADNRRRRAFLESVVNFGTLKEPEDFGDASIMTSEFKNWRNRVERSASGGFNAIWRGHDVYENGRVKKFETEEDARAYLDRCDTAGWIIHRGSKRKYDVRVLANRLGLEACRMETAPATPGNGCRAISWERRARRGLREARGCSRPLRGSPVSATQRPH
jgi:hypothetical protein